VRDASAGMWWFQLTPYFVKGQALLEHIVFVKRQIMYYKMGKKQLYAPNQYMDIAMQPGNIEVREFTIKRDLSKIHHERLCWKGCHHEPNGSEAEPCGLYAAPIMWPC
jgi:hypothetical protein